MSPQARKGNPAKGARTNRPAPKTTGTPKPRKRLYALIFGVALLVVAVAVVLIRGQLTAPSEPSDGAVAEVQDLDDGLVSQEDFDAALTRTAEGQGLKEPPRPTTRTSRPFPTRRSARCCSRSGSRARPPTGASR